MTRFLLYFFTLLFFASCSLKKSDYSGDYFCIVKGGKYALFNTKGKQLTKAVYESNNYPCDGMIATKKDNLWGFLDLAGNEVIDFKYKMVSNFHNGLAIAFIDNNKAGFIDKNGTFVINPIYQFARHFHEGLAAVEKDGKWGYIDKKGKVIIPFKYDLATNFHHNRARVWVKTDNSIKNFFINKY